MRLPICGPQTVR